MKAIVSTLHALADETRWRIVQLVFDEALCVCELADILEMPQSSVSSHLQVIKKAGLLDSEKCEKWIYYRLARDQRALVLELSKFFRAMPAANPVLKSDAAKAVKRLAKRNQSCCPAPSTLVSPNTPQSSKRTSKIPQP